MKTIMHKQLSKIKVSSTLLMAVLTGLACARLWLDFGTGWTAAPFAFALGFGIGWYWPAPRWTLFGLWLTLASPVPLLHLAVMAVALASSGVLYAFKSDYSTLSTGILAFVIFLFALAPGVLPGDAGEFQVVAAEWGVAHPPGYPLYTVLAGILAHGLPLENMAWCVNLFSALVGAGAVGLLAHAVAHETRSPWAGRIAGWTLMVSATFWMVSTQASIRPLTVFFVAAMVEAALAYRRAVQEDRPPRAALARFGLAAGFGVTHHGSLVFLGAVLAVGIVAADWRAWRRWPVALIAALPGALPLLYFVIRSDGFLAPAGLDTWDGFWHHALARGFTNDALGNLGPDHWPEHWQVAREMFALQWQPWLLALAVLGLLVVLWRDRWLGLILVAALIAHTAVSITYPASPMSEYMLPTYALLALAVGWLVGHAGGWRAILLSTLALTGIAFCLYANWQTTYRQYDLEMDHRDLLADTLRDTPGGGLILAPWHLATPLWYMQQADDLRPDVEVRYVSPQGAETPMDTWTRQIEESMQDGRGLLVLQNFPESYRHLPYTLAGPRVLATPPPVPDAAAAISFGPHALETDSWHLPGELRAGETARLELTWHLGEAVPYGSLTTFVHLGLADQPPVAQVDLPVQAPALQTTPAAVTLVYDLPVPATVPPGDYGLWVGAYTPGGSLTTPDGEQRVQIGTARVLPGRHPMPTQHPMWRNLGAARLRGWDYDNSSPDVSLLYLHWELRELDRRYEVTLEDTARGTWAVVGAEVGEKPGYWTSLHVLPKTIAALPVRVRLDSSSALIPAAVSSGSYIPFGNAAVLVDWTVTIQGGEVKTHTVWLPFGAAATIIKLHVELVGEGWAQTADFEPVRGQLPAYRWVFERTVRSQQTITLEHTGAVQAVSVLLYDGFTGQRLPVDSSYLSDDFPGVKIGP